MKNQRRWIPSERKEGSYCSREIFEVMRFTFFFFSQDAILCSSNLFWTFNIRSLGRKRRNLISSWITTFFFCASYSLSPHPRERGWCKVTGQRGKHVLKEARDYSVDGIFPCWDTQHCISSLLSFCLPGRRKSEHFSIHRKLDVREKLGAKSIRNGDVSVFCTSIFFATAK